MGDIGAVAMASSVDGRKLSVNNVDGMVVRVEDVGVWRWR